MVTGMMRLDVSSLDGILALNARLKSAVVWIGRPPPDLPSHNSGPPTPP
jgi:hypothetical protein